MREESHLDDMREAIRGDFERLAARRGEQELMRVSEPEAPDEESDVRAEEPLEERSDEQPEQPEAEPAAAGRSWLARMFST